jgi:LPS sulfotransferase NodH
MTFATQFHDDSLNSSNAEFDFKTRAAPKILYFVASTRRSGSTYFCNELWRTGVLGAPMEYFNFRNVMVATISRLAVRSLDEYVRRLVALRTSPNGVFGLQIHFDQYQFMALSDVLSVLRNPFWIFVRRRDVAAQAVSLAKAVQTNQWNSLNVRQAEPSYNFRLVLSCLNDILKQNAGWKRIFETKKIEPIEIVYEDFMVEPDKIVGDLLRRWKVPLEPHADIALPILERQSDGINAEWAERFRHEAAEQGHSL